MPRAERGVRGAGEHLCPAAPQRLKSEEMAVMRTHLRKELVGQQAEQERIVAAF
jgi:hypothetical protein